MMAASSTMHFLSLMFVVAVCSSQQLPPTTTTAITRRVTRPLVGETSCHGVYYHGLGCFSGDYPFNNTQQLPQNPDFIDTAFHLYTRGNKDNPILLVNRGGNVGRNDLRRNKPIKVLIHGFLQNNQSPWVVQMTRTLLFEEDVNVITVDWGQGAVFPYEQAAANTRVVGAELARLTEALRRQRGVSLQQIHMIGHSLGAHVAGHTGARLAGRIGRITGLDPADPNFSFQPPEVRLDPTDAAFVDVIHTDGSPYTTYSGFGTIQPMGHADFYPNGGQNQPGCHSDTSVYGFLSDAYRQGMENAEYAMACSHDRALDLFLESLSSDCPFTAYPCASEDDFVAGRCLDCGGRPCPSMGYRADLSRRQGVFFFNTSSRHPFCGYHYAISISLSESSSTVNGEIRIQITGTDGRSTPPLLFHSGALRPDQDITEVLLAPVDVGQVASVALTFTRNSYWTRWLSSSIKVKGVVVQGIQRTNAKYFCPEHQDLPGGASPLVLSNGLARPGQCLQNRNLLPY